MANPFRAALDMQRRHGAYTGGGSSYAGAASTRLNEDWIFATIKSADQEVKSDLRTLRARSRELVRNNDTASRYCGLVDEQVVGHAGIRLQARVMRPDGKLDLELNQIIEDAWNEWCEPGNCTVDGRDGFIDVLSSLAWSLPQDGEYLARGIPFRNRFGFALQPLDADQLDETFDRAPGTGVNEIRMGVEIDRWGRPVAYHIWDHHPSEYTARGRDRIALPADQVYHLYRRTRVNMTRGVPWFTPALSKLHNIAGYEEAEIVAARIASAKGGWFEVDPMSVPDPNASNAQQNQVVFEIAPGQFDRLPPGWKFREWDPQHPTQAFSEFHKAMLRGVANGLNVSYVSLANDLEGVNFSSIRAGLLNERDAWRKLQYWIIRHFCARVYRTWFQWALETGALRLPPRATTDMRQLMRHRWQPRGWAWVDPEADMQGRLLGTAAGVDSLHRICADQGLDFEEILRERAMEIQLAKELGVPITVSPSKAATRDNNGSNGNGRSNGNARSLDEEIIALAFSNNGNGRHS